MPRPIEATDLSDHAFLRATALLVKIRAEQPGLSRKKACNRALKQAHLEDQDRQRVPHRAASSCPGANVIVAAHPGLGQLELLPEPEAIPESMKTEQGARLLLIGIIAAGVAALLVDQIVGRWRR